MHQFEGVDEQPTNLVPSERVNPLPGDGPSSGFPNGNARAPDQRPSLLAYGSLSAGLPHDQYQLADRRTGQPFSGKPLSLRTMTNTTSAPEYSYHERLDTSSPSQRMPSIHGFHQTSYPMLRPDTTLDDGTASPRPDRLPSFHQLSKIADGGTEAVEQRATVLPSLSTYPGPIIPQSSTALHHQFSPSNQHSPSASFMGLGHHSPTNTMNDGRGVFLSRSPATYPGPNTHLHNPRRSSLGPNRPPLFIPNLTSSSSGETTLSHQSHQSSGAEGYSTAQSTPHETTPSSVDGTPRPSIPGFLRQHSSTSAPGGFVCDYAGCSAPPFQTQYLLNSHANVHSSSRPHYCPVKGCPRGEGGKGFKRKNEMIRHGLVHDSPGYVCPFCPLREHRYPRPDNLQRHVRVHHVDKDKDDPLLREVLAQRPEGGGRGRRRRTGPA